ncbi:MAG TPA: GNAT family N-acetyltransferase [Pseudobdellovibrionaceae bacterium]|nr:GNAT family N-acetyltransferase [Pseudobdellovibrionaceae bacterium]
MTLTLRPLQTNDEKAFFEGLSLWKGEELSWYTFSWKEGMSYAEMLKILRDEEAGRNLAPDRVPHTMLYGFIDGKIVGRVSVRHTLNEYLRQRGGHMGYAVAPSCRGRGIATEMVKQALLHCRSLNLEEILVTCADTNTASWKIIERFGGRLEDRVWDSEDEETIRRYWVRTGRP